MISIARSMLALALALVAACLASPGSGAGEQEASAAVTARGPRVLAMDVGPGPGETVDAAVAAARAAGVTTAVLNYNWSDLEPSAFQYQNAKLIADNLYYATSPHPAGHRSARAWLVSAPSSRSRISADRGWPRQFSSRTIARSWCSRSLPAPRTRRCTASISGGEDIVRLHRVVLAGPDHARLAWDAANGKPVG